jgi:quinol-cytochrome oxidoreductase complex cytochrome b subunit
MFLFIEPDILGNENNQILANSLVTPPNIIPERYFLLLHSVPRSIPVKRIGDSIV